MLQQNKYQLHTGSIFNVLEGVPSDLSYTYYIYVQESDGFTSLWLPGILILFSNSRKFHIHRPFAQKRNLKLKPTQLGTLHVYNTVAPHIWIPKTHGERTVPTPTKASQTLGFGYGEVPRHPAVHATAHGLW